MLIIIPILIAAICKAFSDTLDHHFFTSIFKKKKQSFWNPNVIHKTGKQIFGYPIDAWHISNTIQILAWLSLPFLYEPTNLKWYFEYGIGGVIFMAVFNLFYNKIFR